MARKKKVVEEEIEEVTEEIEMDEDLDIEDELDEDLDDDLDDDDLEEEPVEEKPAKKAKKAAPKKAAAKPKGKAKGKKAPKITATTEDGDEIDAEIVDEAGDDVTDIVEFDPEVAAESLNAIFETQVKRTVEFYSQVGAILASAKKFFLKEEYEQWLESNTGMKPGYASIFIQFNKLCSDENVVAALLENNWGTYHIKQLVTLKNEDNVQEFMAPGAAKIKPRGKAIPFEEMTNEVFDQAIDLFKLNKGIKKRQVELNDQDKFFKSSLEIGKFIEKNADVLKSAVGKGGISKGALQEDGLAIIIGLCKNLDFLYQIRDRLVKKLKIQEEVAD